MASVQIVLYCWKVEGRAAEICAQNSIGIISRSFFIFVTLLFITSAHVSHYLISDSTTDHPSLARSRFCTISYCPSMSRSYSTFSHLKCYKNLWIIPSIYLVGFICSTLVCPASNVPTRSSSLPPSLEFSALVSTL